MSIMKQIQEHIKGAVGAEPVTMSAVEEDTT
jgi:hypothetical protein